MNIFQILTLVIALIPVVFTFASLLKRSEWWIRASDFPRIQIIVWLLVALILTSWFYNFSEIGHFILFGLLLYCLAYQIYRIYPYTFLAAKEVLGVNKLDLHSEEDNSISVLVSNVLTPNRQWERLLSVVRLKNPDMLLTLESDKWWQKKLDRLETDYPYTVKVPLDNLYGMHLYSKLEIVKAEVSYLVEGDVPSIEAQVKLNSGKMVRIFCLHPAPPSPTQNETSDERDAELMMVAKAIDGQSETVLVMGDLNDVAWSRSTSLFLKISGLLDPRKGRGFFNTFHAGYALLRWAFAYFFISNDFKLITMERQENMGSDHFPIYSKFQYIPEARLQQNMDEEPDADDKQEADEKIEKVR